MLFEKVLPAEKLNPLCQSKRKRIYDHSTTFWAWCSQILEGNASCHKAVSHVQSWREQLNLPIPSSQTKAYCKARQKLPEKLITESNQIIINELSQNIQHQDLWYELEIKAIDGSSVQLMDTPENQAAYPQPSGQKKGCGFPVMGITGVVNLSHGGWEALATSEQTKHDLSTAYDVLEHFGEGDLCLADRAYNSYEFVTRLKSRNCHSLMRLHQARKRHLDWKKGEKLGVNDRLYTWKKPSKKAPGSRLNDKEWQKLPDTMKIRITRFKKKKRDQKIEWIYLATTLTDCKKYPYDDLCKLYHDRWLIELKFRDIKTMLNMEFIRAKTPELAEKTIQMLQLIYNMIHALMQSARQAHFIEKNRLSFMGCVNQINSYSSNYKGHHNHSRKRKKLLNSLLKLLSEELILKRKERHEPRARKRRPKNYHLLTKDRHEFSETQHRSRYKKTV